MQDVFKKILGIDFGDFTIGLAIFDEKTNFTFPYKTLYRSKANILRKSIREIIEIIFDEKITQVVIGYPLNFDGTEGERVKKTKVFAEMLAKKIDALEERTGKKVEIDFQDERLTTIEAKDILKGHGVKAKDYKTIIDQVAAEVIINDYVNNRGKK